MAKKYTADKKNDEPISDMTFEQYIAKYGADILSQIAQMNGTDALTFWRKTFAPFNPIECKRKVKNSIDWPYANRIIRLSRGFIQLDVEGRTLVTQAAREKIYWRGDSIEFFNTVITETIMYRGLTDQEREVYRQRIWAVSQNLAQRHEQAA